MFDSCIHANYEPIVELHRLASVRPQFQRQNATGEMSESDGDESNSDS